MQRREQIMTGESNRFSAVDEKRNASWQWQNSREKKIPLTLYITKQNKCFIMLYVCVYMQVAKKWNTVQMLTYIYLMTRKKDDKLACRLYSRQRSIYTEKEQKSRDTERFFFNVSSSMSTNVRTKDGRMTKFTTVIWKIMWRVNKKEKRKERERGRK